MVFGGVFLLVCVVWLRVGIGRLGGFYFWLVSLDFGWLLVGSGLGRRFCRFVSWLLRRLWLVLVVLGCGVGVCILLWGG